MILLPHQRAVWFWITLIAALSIFGRQLLAALSELSAIWNQPSIKMAALLVAWLVTVALLLAKSKGRELMRAAVGALVATLLALQLPLVEEQMHIFTFWVLGMLLVRDYQAQAAANPAWQAIITGCLVGVLDEMLQAALPWRIFDLRDIAFNCGAAGLGILSTCQSK